MADISSSAVDVSRLIAAVKSPDNSDVALLPLASAIDRDVALQVLSTGGLDTLKGLVRSRGTPDHILRKSLSVLRSIYAQGLDSSDDELVDRLVELFVTQPNPDVVRASMTTLSSLITIPSKSLFKGITGIERLNGYIAMYPGFLKLIVGHLHASDGNVAVSAFQLINRVVSDLVAPEDSSTEENCTLMDAWPHLISQLQAAGIVQSTLTLMLDTYLSPELEFELIEFQSKMRNIIRRWKRRRVSPKTLSSHAEAMNQLYALGSEIVKILKAPDDPESVWRTFGFENTVSPELDFELAGWLGLVDVQVFIEATGKEEFIALLCKECDQSEPERLCPIVKASLAVSILLCDFFDITNSPDEDRTLDPLILRWGTLHTAGLTTFIKVWKESKSVTGSKDFDRITDLVRVLFQHVADISEQNGDLSNLQEAMEKITYPELRRMQLEFLERDAVDEENYLAETTKLKCQLAEEALEFVMEQRVNCLLQGAWFLNHSPDSSMLGPTAHHNPPSDRRVEESASVLSDPSYTGTGSSWGAWHGKNYWKYMRLSHNRRQLHYGDYDQRLTGKQTPSLDELPGVIDLSSISIISLSNNVEVRQTCLGEIIGLDTKEALDKKRHSVSRSMHSLNFIPSAASAPAATMLGTSNISNGKFVFQLSLHGYRSGMAPSSAHAHESVLLQVYAQSVDYAAEWYDGLNILVSRNGFASVARTLKSVAALAPPSPSAIAMAARSSNGRRSVPVEQRLSNLLREQFTVTSETTKYIRMITDMTFNIRMLDVNVLRASGVKRAPAPEILEYPSANFYYSDPF